MVCSMDYGENIEMHTPYDPLEYENLTIKTNYEKQEQGETTNTEPIDNDYDNKIRVVECNNNNSKKPLRIEESRGLLWAAIAKASKTNYFIMSIEMAYL
mmetsp:Transcript_34583/g.81526  ORF Transcript_34583/g.81526 Transcript_34583/m.81526 type:complete len:99 (+) Transcript_34583:986-1282(+)